jgi:uncharacterized membrane protein YphA (DoxX/SURF4 family)
MRRNYRIPLLVAEGLFGRPASIFLAIGFAAATACSLGAEEPILLPAIFALIFVALAWTGPGAYSLDGWRSSRKRSAP